LALTVAGKVKQQNSQDKIEYIFRAFAVVPQMPPMLVVITSISCLPAKPPSLPPKKG